MSPPLKRPVTREQCERKCRTSNRCLSYNYSVQHYAAESGQCTLYTQAFAAHQMPREAQPGFQRNEVFANVNWYCRKASTLALAADGAVALF